MKIDSWDLVLFSVVVLHLWSCPFTKVEESFNLQATHDFLFHKFDVNSFDHHEFPGVVPRTFLGSFWLALFSAPFHFLSTALDCGKFASQFIVRAVLGAMCVFSLSFLRYSIEPLLGRDVGKYLMLIYSLQFHLPFYFTRTLPNTFALVLIKKNLPAVISIFAFAGLIFRSELIILALPIGLLSLYNKEITFFYALQVGFVSGVISVVLSIALDSYVWSYVLWPEGQVLYFNTFMNKSHLWGTLPFYWYFLVAIPKAMHGTLPFFFAGVYYDLKQSKILLRLLGPAIVFVFLYSFLPHKELRFIFYAFPVLNLVAAFGLSKILKLKPYPTLTKLLVLGICLGCIAISSGLLFVSSTNYPGGQAFANLHKIEKDNTNVSVHINPDAAMTGVSRFGELRSDWRYFKTEGDVDHFQYSHLITSNMSLVNDPRFEVLDRVEGFSHIQKTTPFVVFKPLLFLLRQKR